jgi:Na+/H+ antiporter NhaD/arsenite permease-like protein
MRSAWQGSQPLQGLEQVTSVSFIDGQTVKSVFVEKIDIIFLILSFAVLSEGMRTSNIFSYLASHISDYSNSSYQLLIESVAENTSLLRCSQMKSGWE